MAAKVFFYPACVRVTELLSCETSKISTTEIFERPENCIVSFST